MPIITGNAVTMYSAPYPCIKSSPISVSTIQTLIYEMGQENKPQRPALLGPHSSRHLLSRLRCPNQCLVSWQPQEDPHQCLWLLHIKIYCVSLSSWVPQPTCMKALTPKSAKQIQHTSLDRMQNLRNLQFDHTTENKWSKRRKIKKRYVEKIKEDGQQC